MTTVPPDPTDAVGAALERLVANACADGAPSCIVRVESPLLDATWETCAGTVRRHDPRPVGPHSPFRTASITKSFTAVVVARLADDGRFGIDDPVIDHLAGDVAAALAALHVVDGRSRAESITIRHLLDHSSGLDDHASSASFIDELIAAPARRWTGRALLGAARRARPSPVMPDRRRFRYSDTGYVVLATMIEHVCGGAFHEVLRRLLLDPLGLDATWLEGYEQPHHEPICHAYRGDDDTMAVHGSADWGAGGLVSTARDLTSFMRALVAGELLAATTCADVLRFDERRIDAHTGRHGLCGYGLGIEARRRSGRLLLGHSGAWGAFVYAEPATMTTFAGTLNHSGDGLHRFVEDLVAAVDTR